MRFSSAEFSDEQGHAVRRCAGRSRWPAPAIGLAAGFDPGVEAIAGGDPSVILGLVNGLLVDPALSIDAGQMSTYLSMRAFERERREVELLQAGVVEKQRLRREVALLNERKAEREAAEAAARRRRSGRGWQKRRPRGWPPRRPRGWPEEEAAPQAAETAEAAAQAAAIRAAEEAAMERGPSGSR
jgi:hypothetical protein